MEIALSKFRIFAGTLADDAAAISMSWFRRHPDIDTKPDRSPVTIADTSIEAHRAWNGSRDASGPTASSGNNSANINCNRNTSG